MLPKNWVTLASFTVLSSVSLLSTSIQEAAASNVVCNPYGQCFQRQVWCDSYNRCYQRFIPVSLKQRSSNNTNNQRSSNNTNNHGYNLCTTFGDMSDVLIYQNNIDCRIYGLLDRRGNGKAVMNKINSLIR